MLYNDRPFDYSHLPDLFLIGAELLRFKMADLPQEDIGFANKKNMTG